MLTHWLQTFVEDVDSRESPQIIDPAVRELQFLIESKADLQMIAAAMFDEIPDKTPYHHSPAQHKHVRDYHHMLHLFNVIVTGVAPGWGLSELNTTLIEVPFCAVLDWPMGTRSGHAFFLRKDVSEKLKLVLDAWREKVLKTSKSQYVITTDDGGWLCKDALAAIESEANFDSQKCYTFEDLFKCDPQGDPVHWGFQSWDHFFTRQFSDIDKLRPVAYSNKPEWVVNACESRPLTIKSNIQKYDKFWQKGQNYSVAEMLDHHEFADQFIGGTVYQAFLSSTSYHRWSSPVSGQVVYARNINGAYFSESQNQLGNPESSDHQVYLCQVASRALIFIQAPDPIGLMCVIAIGMVDISTCEIRSKFCTSWPQPVEKGEEIGMFHYGGSSHCLLFRKGVNLSWVGEAIPGTNLGRNLPIRSQLALAYTD